MPVPDSLRDALRDRYTLDRELGRGEVSWTVLAGGGTIVGEAPWSTRQQ